MNFWIWTMGLWAPVSVAKRVAEMETSMPRSRSGSRAAAPRRPRTVSSPAAIIGRDRASLLVLARATVLTEGFDPDAGERGAVIRASAVGGIYRDAPAALPP